MTITELMALPTVADHCRFHQAVQPYPSVIALPPDLYSFYHACNGADLLLQNTRNRWRVHPIEGLIGLEQWIWGDERRIAELLESGQINPICLKWWVIAHSLADGNLVVVIDLNEAHFGRCYFTTSDKHSWDMEDIVIAGSFTEWLERLLTTPGDCPYWEVKGFERISAYT